jgi:hypothetical protein
LERRESVQPRFLFVGNASVQLEWFLALPLLPHGEVIVNEIPRFQVSGRQSPCQGSNGQRQLALLNFFTIQMDRRLECRACSHPSKNNMNDTTGTTIVRKQQEKMLESQA